MSQAEPNANLYCICRLMYMEPQPQNLFRETLLIYLPCYVDYQMAIAQAARIRDIEKLNSPVIDLSIKVMISCNGVELSEVDMKSIEEVCDFWEIFPFGISGDINITQGFVQAIRHRADYLWILSSNDKVSDSFIETIFDKLVKNREVNLLAGSSHESSSTRKVDSVFDSVNQDLPFGLISSVVYRTKEMDKNFDAAVQLNWTGWGQLAAIESSCIALDGINVAVTPEWTLHTRSNRTLEDPYEERRRVRNAYAHSFFGMPTVISILHANAPHKRKKYLNGWIFANWYLVNYFLRTNHKLWSAHIASNQSWLRTFAFAAVNDASTFHRALFRIARIINFDALKHNLLAQKLLKQHKGKN